MHRLMPRRPFAFLIAAAFAALAPASNAALVPFHFAATTRLGLGALPPALAAVQDNDPYYLSFNLDTSVADSEFSSSYAIYSNAVKDFTFRFPSKGITLNLGTASLTVSNASTNFQYDELRFDLAYTSTATAIFWLRAQSNGVIPATALANDLMPTTIDPSAFNFTQVAGMYNPNGGRPTIFGALNNTITVVPEPAAAGVLTSVVAALLRRNARFA